MTARLYGYVGPLGLVPVGADSADGVVEAYDVLVARVRALAASGPLTFVVDGRERLRLASRQTEHVALAGGEPVLAAGEITFEIVAGQGLVAAEVSNQSTGYCPEPSSWTPLALALDRLGVGRPVDFTNIFTFRRCDHCAAINIVKDSWFVCAECDSELPQAWNL